MKTKAKPTPKLPPTLRMNAARVQYCGHNGWFIADVYEVGDAVVVRASGPITPDKINRPAENCTHHVLDFPDPGFWRPDLGILVVPKSQCSKL